MAATEESASERWWKALATSVGAAVRVPTAWVMRKSHSFLVGVGCGAGVPHLARELDVREGRVEDQLAALAARTAAARPADAEGKGEG